MVVSEISTARRGIVFGVFQCCATGITDGGLPRVVFESYSARRKDSIEKSILNWKKKWTEYLARFFLCTGVGNVVPSNDLRRIYVRTETAERGNCRESATTRTSSRQTVCIRSKRSPLG